MIEKSEKQAFFVNFGFYNYLKMKCLQKRILQKKGGKTTLSANKRTFFLSDCRDFRCILTPPCRRFVSLNTRSRYLDAR